MQIDIPQEENYFYLGYYAYDEGEGYAVIGKVLNLFLIQDTLYRVISKNNILVYVQTPFYHQTPKLSLVGYFVDGDSSVPFTIGEDHLKLINSGINWRLFRIDPDKPINLKSLRVVFNDDGA